MKYFDVEKETLYGNLYIGVVNSDGSQAELPEDLGERTEITLGFLVIERDEEGTNQNQKYYSVRTNGETYENNEEEVLEKIKQDYPPTEWQNHNW